MSTGTPAARPPGTPAARPPGTPAARPPGTPAARPPGMLARIVRVSRVRDWSVQIPILLIVMATYVCGAGAASSAYWRDAGWVLLMQTLFLAGAYLLNDVFDREADREKNQGLVRSLRETRSAAIIAALLYAIGLSLSLELEPLKRPVGWALVAVSIAYSVPGVRFKERGILGLLVPACLQRLAPFVFALEWPPRAWPLALALCAWLFFLGFEFILDHQIEDELPDRRAGVNTWTTRVGRARAIRARDLASGLFALAGIAAALVLLAPTPRRFGVVGAALILGATALAAWLIRVRYAATYRSEPPVLA